MAHLFTAKEIAEVFLKVVCLHKFPNEFTEYIYKFSISMPMSIVVSCNSGLDSRIASAIGLGRIFAVTNS